MPLISRIPATIDTQDAINRCDLQELSELARELAVALSKLSRAELEQVRRYADLGVKARMALTDISQGS